MGSCLSEIGMEKPHIGVNHYAPTTHKTPIRRGVLPYAPGSSNVNTIFHSPSNNLGSIIRGFKASTTILINESIGNSEGGSIWQRNYYEHIINTDEELENIREYIRTNPKKWERDRNNPTIIK